MLSNCAYSTCYMYVYHIAQNFGRFGGSRSYNPPTFYPSKTSYVFEKIIIPDLLLQSSQSTNVFPPKCLQVSICQFSTARVSMEKM